MTISNFGDRKKLSTIERGYFFEFWSKSVQILIFWYQTICFHKLWLETRILTKNYQNRTKIDRAMTNLMFGERKISVKIAVFRSKSVQILIFWYQTLCFHKLWLKPRRLIQQLSKSDQNWPSYDNFKFRWSQKVKHNRARLLFWILVKIGPNFNFLIPNDMFS